MLTKNLLQTKVQCLWLSRILLQGVNYIDFQIVHLTIHSSIIHFCHGSLLNLRTTEEFSQNQGDTKPNL